MMVWNTVNILNLEDFSARIVTLFNTDGVALFRSSTTDIWPVFLAVNELPPHMKCNLPNYCSVRTV